LFVAGSPRSLGRADDPAGSRIPQHVQALPDQAAGVRADLPVAL